MMQDYVGDYVILRRNIVSCGIWSKEVTIRFREALLKL